MKVDPDADQESERSDSGELIAAQVPIPDRLG